MLHAPQDNACINLPPSGFKPVRGVSQAMHFMAVALFCTRHVSQSQSIADLVLPDPGLAVSQAMHFVAVALFCTRHVPHSQSTADLVLPNPGLVVSQAMHFVAVALFCTKQVSHSHAHVGLETDERLFLIGVFFRPDMQINKKYRQCK